MWSNYIFLVLGLLLSFCYNLACLDYRLSGEVLPDFYNISIRPYLFDSDGIRRFTFDGEVEITLHSTVDGLRNITLHKDYINITEARIYKDNDRNKSEAILLASLIYEEETDKLTVPLSNALEKSASYTIYFRYTGLMRNGTAGLYPTYYEDDQGKVTWIALTQLQRIHAREVFPCFDEPSLKAKYQLHLSRPKNYSSFFNTKLLSTNSDGPEREVDHFDVTPLMSTYLVAFMMAPYRERAFNDVSIWSRPEFYDKTEFAFNVTLKTIDGYERLLERTYKSLGNEIFQEASAPLFPHNGMENWGLILYKDSVLVQHPNYTDGFANKEYLITIIVHETAHMWFGNSVTFQWWSFFWLNEAFARYYQYFLANELFPEYQLDEQFVVNQVHLIFATDAVNSTQPMTSPAETIETPSQIASKFSSIAYAKGASIVRMFCNLMGKEHFTKAIRDYLNENHLNSTVPADLFKHLKKNWPAGHRVDLDTFFADWTEQVGFPMVTVSLSADSSFIVLRQNRFLLSPSDGSDASLLYTIPITFATNKDKNFGNLTPKFYFNKTKSISYVFDEPVQWVILNLQQSNFYRVFYEEPLLGNIREALLAKNHSAVPSLNRAHIIDDLLNYGRIGLMDYSKVFHFLEYLSGDVDYTPWYAAFSGMSRVAQRLEYAHQKDFGAFLARISHRVYDKLGFGRENDTILDIYNRNKVIAWRCKYNLGDCRREAEALFLEMQTAHLRPSPDFRETLYCAAHRNNKSIFLTLQAIYQNETFEAEQEMLVRAMACTDDEELVEEFYDQLLKKFPQNHLTIGIKALYTSTLENVDRVFALLTDTYEDLEKRLGSYTAVANIIQDLAQHFTTEEQKEDLEKFVEEHGKDFGSALSILQRSIQNVENNLRWADARLSNLIEFLKSGNGAEPSQASLMIVGLVSLVYWTFS